MLLGCGCSGRLESVLDVMWVLAVSNINSRAYTFSVCVELFLPLFLEILVMYAVFVVWVARTLHLPQKSFLISVLVSCTQASSSDLCT